MKPPNVMTTPEWESLAFSLAQHLSKMEDGEVFMLYSMTAEPDEFGNRDEPRYLQFCAHGDDQIRCEVSNNDVLPEAFQMTAEETALFANHGWIMPEVVVHDGIDSGSPNIYMDVEQVFCDFVADSVVVILRDVWHLTSLKNIGTDKESLRGLRKFVMLDPPTSKTCEIEAERAKTARRRAWLSRVDVEAPGLVAADDVKLGIATLILSGLTNDPDVNWIAFRDHKKSRSNAELLLEMYESAAEPLKFLLSKVPDELGSESSLVSQAQSLVAEAACVERGYWMAG